MKKPPKVTLSEKQKEAIAKQIAEFFFEFWDKRPKKIGDVSSLKPKSYEQSTKKV